MSSTSRLNTLFTSALTLVALQVFVPHATRTTAAPASQAGATAKSQSTVKYQPPKRMSPKRTEGTGVRSSSGFKCPTSENSLFIAALAPTTHTGDTLSDRPTLYTYFNGTESIEINLREIGTRSPVWTQTVPTPTPGFSAIAYPSTAPELVVGKQYQWSVEVICDATKRYLNKGYTSAKIQRVETPTAFQDSLSKAKTPIDRAQVYATQSLWYEALDTLASASLAAPTDSALRTQLIDLLEQGGLVKAAKQAREAKGPSSPVIPGTSDRPGIKPSHCKENSTDPAEIKPDRTRCP